MDPERSDLSYYGIVIVKNGAILGAASRAPRDRVRRFITRNPGARAEQIVEGLRMTPGLVAIALANLQKDGEIYCLDKNATQHQWMTESLELAPPSFCNSVWMFASSFAGLRSCEPAPAAQ